MHMAARLEALHAALGCVDGFAESYRLSASLAFFDGLNYAEDLSGAAEYVLAKAAQGVRGEEASPIAPADVPEPNLVERVTKSIGRAEGATQALKELLSDAALSVALQLLEMRAAFERFCRKCVGVTPEVLWGGWDFPPDLLETMAESLKPYEQFKPRPKQVRAFFDAMSRAWLERFGPGVTFVPHDP